MPFCNSCSLSSFPAALGALTSLQELHVGNNKLTSLPDEIGLLCQLQILKANNNRYYLSCGDYLISRLVYIWEEGREGFHLWFSQGLLTYDQSNSFMHNYTLWIIIEPNLTLIQLLCIVGFDHNKFVVFRSIKFLRSLDHLIGLILVKPVIHIQTYFSLYSSWLLSI